MNDRHSKSPRRSFLRNSALLLLSSALPRLAVGCDESAARYNSGFGAATHDGAYYAEFYDNRNGDHRLTIVAASSFEGRAATKAVEVIAKVLGAEFYVRFTDILSVNMEMYIAPIECRMSGPLDCFELHFSANPNPPEEEYSWIEDADGNEVFRETPWYEDEYWLNVPLHELRANLETTNLPQHMPALEDAIRRALSISPIVNQLGEVNSLILIERALMASDFAWKVEQCTWT